MTDTLTLNRRRFLQTGAAAAGSLVIGFYLPMGGRRGQAAAETTGNGAELINAWLRIDPDNTVTMMVPSSEMGQGVYTSMPMLIAEELEIDWSQVRAEMAPVGPQYSNLIFDMQATGGSTSIRWAFDSLRQVGAQAREVLRAAAANKWDVPVEQTKAEGGFVIHTGSEKKQSYGELAGAAAKLEPPTNVALKPKSEWKLLGTPAKRLDTPDKVTGRAGFGIDVQVDGMLFGTVKACPVFGGSLKAVDKAPALAVKGVKDVVTLDDAVVVVADGYWPAKKGLDALRPEWDPGANADNSSEKISAMLHKGLGQQGAVAKQVGNSTKVLGQAAKTIEAVYEAPILAHATMEPMNATAHVTADHVDVWIPTQGPGLIPGIVAKLTGVKPEQVDVHTTFLGGGFGRRFEVDFMIQSVLTSKAVSAPVKLIWSREEDTRHDFYRPASVVKLAGGLDSAGAAIALNARICCPSIFSRVFPDYVKDGIDHTSVEGFEDTLYNFANLHVDYVMQEIGVPVGFWRAVGNSQNAFFMESFIDEMAHAAGVGPVEFRRDLLVGRPRHRAVLEKLMEASGWGSAPAGRVQGVALHESFGSIIGEVVEASVSDDGKLTMHKITCVVDCGTVVNPDTVEAQMDSAIVYGLTAALFGEVTIKNGAVEQGNFDTYPMLRLAHMPPVETHIIESGAKLGGIGEPALPPAAPALANAIFAATGKRIRSLPLSAHGITMA